MTYLVTYDSGEGLVNESMFTLKVAETDVVIDSYSCFYTVTEMDPLPERKANAIIVGSTKVTLAADEIWRSQEDLRVVLTSQHGNHYEALFGIRRLPGLALQ
jgi:hypothetical protein